MRRIAHTAAAGIFAGTFSVLLFGCAATMSVSSHARDGLDAAAFRTYAWGPADALPTGDPRLDKNPYFQDYLQGAVEKQLAMRGIEHAASGTPDLLIHYHANVDTRIDVNRTEREYGYCQGADCQSWVVEYEAGTLVLDMVDAHTNRLVWRGWAQDSVQAFSTRETMARQINEAVSRMLARFPQPQR